MLRDTTEEKIPAYFTGFAVEKAPARSAFALSKF
jgi:hypothetical protein